MNDVAIRVEGLGKSYRLRHERGGGANYRTLREELLGLPRRLRAKREGKGAAREEFWALRDVSFEVKPGEVFGIIGRNGAGKSTLLKILSRITEPTCGQIDLYGRVGSLLEVGTGFHPELTGRENIFLNGAILGMRRPEIRRRFDEIVAFAGVEKFLDTPCKHYSSGMYMRLGFAVAAHLDAEILLVDEVLAVGDAEFQRKCLGKMSEVAGSGRTVVLVSHQLDAVQRLCAYAIWLDQGKLGRVGNVGLVLDGYRAEMDRRAPATWDVGVILGAESDGVELKRIRIHGENEKNVESGGSLQVEVEYQTLSAYAGWNAALVFRLSTVSGVELLRLSTEPISGYCLGRLRRNGTIRLKIHDLPLLEGAVVVGLALTRPNLDTVIDLSDIGRLEIRGTDVYGSGQILREGKGLVFSRHQWSHEAAS